jgi:hypothetical protein
VRVTARGQMATAGAAAQGTNADFQFRGRCAPSFAPSLRTVKERVPVVRTDSDIQRDVQLELEWSPEVESTDIAVKVKDAVVSSQALCPVAIRNIGPSARRAASRESPQ